MIILHHGREGTKTRTILSYVSFILSRNISTMNPHPIKTPINVASHLGNSLVVAFVVKALCRNGGVRNLEREEIPISEDLVLQILQRNTLDIEKKVNFFKWCTLRPNYKHSSTTYKLMLNSISRFRVHHQDIFDILTSMKRDGYDLDHPTFKLLLNAFLKSDRFDSALEILDHVEEDFGKVTASFNPEHYSFVLVAFIRKGQVNSALSIFFKFQDKLPDAIVCNELLVALRKANMKKEFIQVLDKLRNNKEFGLDLWGYNICIHAFGCCWGDLGMSLTLFKEMKDKSNNSIAPDLCTYNSLIHALCLSRKVEDAIIVWEELKESGHEPDNYTYRTLIQGCCKSYRIEDASKIFSEMHNNGLRPDTVIYNSLLDGLFKAKRVTDACDVFEKMIEEGVRASCWTYNILIDGLIKNGRGVAAYTMFCDLKKKGSFVDGVTYSILILQFCKEGQIEEALKLTDEMEQRGFVVDLVTITSLLIELVREGRWDLMKRLLKHVRDENMLPSFLKWKTNIDALMKSSRIKRMDLTSLFSSENGLAPYLSSSNEPPSAVVDEEVNPWSPSPHMDRISNNYCSNLTRGKRVQPKHEDSFDTDMVNTYLSVFLAKGNLSLACKLFETFTDMGLNPIGYTYNSFMSAFVKKGYFDEAWGVLHEMGQKLCPADIATYNVIIHGLGKMGRADLACVVLDTLTKQGGHLDVVMYNTLINALGKCGKLDEANKLFEQMKSSGINPDLVTFNTMIDIYGKSDRVQDAHRYLKMMLDAGYSPNHVTDTILQSLEKK
ncbi:pentatricopeptide repeat-containing protein At4g01570 [Impatiens glandulifera]|uniref:pentatricopeptide repeat-containing protein At4g01570 n=1 Tax=Impatiens glandulifera TaxID=253017 RepID=UPI001FB0AC11|nr:pentatricopeptide repeat-containing protein At4g01570 [Impatiens glandulifera]